MGDSGSLLASLRVLDLSAGDGDAVSRILADLGADVLKVEPPGGSPARTALPRLGGTSIAFALHNANKRSTVLDPADEGDRQRLLDLAGRPTSSSTPAFPAGRRPTAPRARTWPTASGTWWRCR